MMDSYAGTPLHELQLLMNHVQIKVIAPNNEPIIVDEGIADLLITLWGKGYETLFSCQGDPWDESIKNNRRASLKLSGYICFATESMASSFYDIVNSVFPVDDNPLYGRCHDSADIIRFSYEALILFQEALSE